MKTINEINEYRQIASSLKISLDELTRFGKFLLRRTSGITIAYNVCVDQLSRVIDGASTGGLWEVQTTAWKIFCARCWKGTRTIRFPGSLQATSSIPTKCWTVYHESFAVVHVTTFVNTFVHVAIFFTFMQFTNIWIEISASLKGAYDKRKYN
jgi:hypothetical protein